MVGVGNLTDQRSVSLAVAIFVAIFVSLLMLLAQVKVYIMFDVVVNKID